MRWLRGAGLFVLLLVVVGCNSGPRTVSVSGRVTMDKKPLAGAQVAFKPANASGPQKEAVAQTDADGKYSLKTVEGDRAGAIPGDYRVEIAKVERGVGRGAGGRGGITQVVPKQYNQNSKLTFKVSPEGTSTADFDITSR